MSNTYVVTGATGFVGKRLIQDLVKDPANKIIAIGRNTDTLSKETGITVIKGDLVNPETFAAISEPVDYIIHCAALSSPWGTYEEFYNANVVATENIIAFAKEKKIKRLVHISTPSVYFEHRDKLNVKESDPLPKKFVNNYAYTKYLADLKIIEAYQNGLETIMLRPKAIIGAGDTVIMPRVLRAYSEGKLTIVGDGKNRVDLTSVTNLIHAIKLCINAPKEALGKAYNITNDDPILFWEVINSILLRFDKQPVKKRIPSGVAYLAASFYEWKAKAIDNNKEPALTKYGVTVLAKSMVLNIDLAKEKLGYKPVQTTQQCIEEFIAWYKKENE